MVGVLALLLAACGGALESDTIAGDELTEVGGCGDARAYAATADDRHLISVRWDGAATRAVEAGGLDEQVRLAHDDVEVELQIGQQLAERLCTDVIDPAWPEIEQRWTAVAGGAGIVVEAAEDDHPVATVTLHDVEFEQTQDGGDHRWRLEEVEIVEVDIGWYAG